LGGQDYLVQSDFERGGIEVKFQQFFLPEYKQCFPKAGFIPGLSILDLLFNEGVGSKDIIKSGIKPCLDWGEYN
jgi:hypothetical protein